ncbi:MAG TPA: 30S ribosomal protein S16 [Candidatus Marinimicrobia bacterium]|nr:30S ribosomal protein S16 [Candidatus Neomarinimicrobiota bacterium]HRS51684.1 30S ribosomal protein S16 [Candidatus Neomarinimicrobiota bacterium]HRU92166.1 30S ribosomal protein S16 [Candidatus Neomarinimicrobiota bacterium]
MAVKIRLQRVGRKKKPFYWIVAMDSKCRRDGRYLDKLGYYDPLTKPATIKIEKEKILSWLEKGAIPSDTVFNLLQKEGIALEWHLIRNNVSEQARNIEIQKWQLAHTKSAETVESIEEKQTIEVQETEPVTVSENVEKELTPETEPAEKAKSAGAKRTKPVKPSAEEAMPDIEIPEETTETSSDEEAESKPEIQSAT